MSDHASSCSSRFASDSTTGEPICDCGALRFAEMNVRWARWAKALGYPFDFTAPDAIPDADMLDAIAAEWQKEGWDSFDDARWDVYEEALGAEKARAAIVGARLAADGATRDRRV